MQGTSTDLSIETSEKCAIGSEKKTEILTAENCFRKIMDNKKGNAGKKRSPDSDHGQEYLLSSHHFYFVSFGA
jgi:hypothetical protein